MTTPASIALLAKAPTMSGNAIDTGSVSRAVRPARCMAWLSMTSGVIPAVLGRATFRPLRSAALVICPLSERSFRTTIAW